MLKPPHRPLGQPMKSVDQKQPHAASHASAACAASTVVKCAIRCTMGHADSASQRRANEPSLSHATAAGSAMTTVVEIVWQIPCNPPPRG